ncbi:ribosome recycling factor [Patescibacteria group bacterium]|nr:ribosome recycling factor [Patescibacteria group bacterium]MBU1890908.1 ribosome recycling factor [Patescibacteria group bacterium]
MAKDLEQDLEKAKEFFSQGLSVIRIGRATPALVENLMVDYYGTPTPLLQLASISAPDPKTLVIQPFDKNSTQGIEQAILKSDIGINPASDSDVIRLPFPPMTEERRLEIVKIIGEKTEKARVAIRQIREEHIKNIKIKKDSGDISEDQYFAEQKNIQKHIDESIKEINQIEKKKQEEITNI